MSEAELNDSGGESLLDPDREAQAFDHLRPLPRVSIQVFCESDDVMETMKACSEDRRMARVHFRAVQGGIDTATEMYTSVPTPNLIVLENLAPPSVLMTQLSELAEVCDPTTKVVVIGHDNDVRLYRDLIRQGISEYMIAPVTLGDMIGVVSTIFVDPEAEPLGRTVAFVGAKGGVGSSTVAHNCAWGISHLFETEVILADLDLAFGTASINFDQDPPQGIAEAVFSPERLDDVFLDRLLAKCASHLSMLAAPSLLDRTYDFASDALEPVLEIVQRSAPITVFDVPHLWEAWTRTLMKEVDEVIVTAVPDLANLRNTKNLIDTLARLRPNDRAPRLVLNQVGMPKRPEIAISDFCEPLDLEPAAIIAFDAQLFGSAANSGRMIAETDGKSATAETFSQLAHVLTGRSDNKSRKKTGLQGLRALLRRS